MKTAVEFLASVLSQAGAITEDDFNSLVEQAKEMEEYQKKELVVATYTYLKMKDCHLPYGMEYLNKISELDDEAEQFYNETFKQ
jgi:hypothetical protein